MKVGSKHVLSHLIFLSIGLLLGWSMYETSPPNAAQTISNLPAAAKDLPALQPITTHQITAKAPENKTTAVELLSLFNQMDDHAFADYMNQKIPSGGIIPNQEVGLELLALLPGITNDLARDKALQALVLENWNSLALKQSPEHETYIEAWLMERIGNYDQQDVWLRVLAELGVNNSNNIQRLIDSLPTTQSIDDRAHILVSLSRNRSYQSPSFEQNTEISRLASKIQHFLTHENDKIRAAAVLSLKTVRDNTRVHEQVLTALRDNSVLVKTQAAVLAFDSRFRTPDITNQLLKNMKDRSLPTYHRGVIASALKNTSLTTQQRSQISEFYKQDQH